MIEFLFGKHGKHVTYQDCLWLLACAATILAPFGVFILMMEGVIG